MAAFLQNNHVTTLHNLTDRPVEELEQLLEAFGKTRPMGLLLPSLYSELSTDALETIVQELKRVRYLGEIVIGLDRACEEDFAHAKEYFGRLAQHHRILWNDGPRLRKIDALLQEEGLAPTEAGKGRNVWYCAGYFLASGRSEVIGLHDCDIITYDRSLLARLMYPMANPDFSFKFAKGYYSRIANGKLNGRVCRLLYVPLVKALKQFFPNDNYLEFLDSFNYPLSGEFSMDREVLKNIRIPGDWGLEVGVLSELYRNYSSSRICQVDISDRYDHKHQELSEEDRSKGLARMATDISKALFRKLATQGKVFSSGIIRSIKATYFRTALDLIEHYWADATFNGLHLDRHREEQAVELFAQCVTEAGERFLAHPQEVPFIPSWSRVISAVPDIMERLYDAVEADNA